MDALDRMFHVLVKNLQASHPALLRAPFTVGDLYSQILPYRHFRRELGLETNQEYEMVLMELLTGARNYLDVDEQLRDELGKELQSAAPEPSRVREFAESHVSLNQTAAAAVPSDSAATPVQARPSASRSRASSAGRQAQPPKPAAGARPPEPLAPPTQAQAGGCRYCGGGLPAGRALNFCPHCGQNLQVLNCPACGAEVESGWKFCVACGKAVA